MEKATFYKKNKTVLRPSGRYQTPPAALVSGSDTLDNHVAILEIKPLIHTNPH
ncbi:MAG: hypothetical protein GY757_32435 [bacterium]|nr:hypothetical protein [bacterium]